jgi:alpha/beta hydrolase fold
MFRSIFVISCALQATCGFAAEPVIERLYAGVAPGSEKWQLPESERNEARGGVSYDNVRDPELHTYAPASAPNGGTGIILLPGGSMRTLNVSPDVRQVIKGLNDMGVTVFLLKYRILQRPVVAAAPRTGPPVFPKMEIRNANANPSPNDAALNEVQGLATADALLSLQRVRAQAARWRLNPQRVGMLGYSAGGGVALAAQLTGSSGKGPDFIASIYGPSLMDVQVAPDAPPLFIATETQHGPVTDGLIALASMWKDANRPVELHMFDVPAFEMPSTLWFGRFNDWLKGHRLLP